MSINLDKMSLMRAFTTKRARPDMDSIYQPQLGRAASLRAGKPVVRAQISGPVALVSTTNMLSYKAPDLPGTVPIENTSSSETNSGEESDTSMLSLDTANVTETSSVDSSPTTPEPEPNHLSCYFKPAVDTTSPSESPTMSRQASFETVPAIPQRMPSHSKKAHERLHRKRSVQRMMSPPASIRSSMDMFGPSAKPVSVEAPIESPFVSELAQLDVVAEELVSAVGDAQADADEEYMEAHGLAAFNVSDYLDEIHELFLGAIAEEDVTWI